MKTTLKYFCVVIALGLAMYLWFNNSGIYSQKEFSQPGMKWRPIPLWFWNDSPVDGDTLEQQLEQMVTRDFYGGCAILPFGGGFRPDYLGPEYFNLYGRVT